VPTGPGRVVALLGPTGVGKTAVAMHVARALGVRIISCDSMQLYRGLPVLTNQPSPEELALVEHALVGVADPDEEWTAATYAEQATAAVDADLARWGWALIVGGTGLYLRTALAPLAIPPGHDPILRARLEERAAGESPDVLYEELRALDPVAASRIHPRNVRRVVRALEVAITAGPGAWSGRDDLWRPAYRHRTTIIGLTMERSILYERIDVRALQMIDGGVVDEVAADRARRSLSPGAKPGAGGRGVCKAIGYAEIGALLDGDATREQTVDRLAAATRRYARRQLTWMRKVPDAVIIDASSRAAADIAADVLIVAQAEPTGPTGT
jgi:tRNA dimethylallyltransferase